AAFDRLRRALGEVCGVPRQRVRPQARVDDPVPLHDRPRYWQELHARLRNLHLPPLRRPAWLVKRIEAASLVPLYLTVLGAIVLISLLAHTPAAPLVTILAVAACPLVGITGMFLMCPAPLRPPGRYALPLPPAPAPLP